MADDNTNQGAGDTTTPAVPATGDTPVVTPAAGDAPAPMGGGTDPVKSEPVEPVTPTVDPVTPAEPAVTPPAGDASADGTDETPPATT